MRWTDSLNPPIISRMDAFLHRQPCWWRSRGLLGLALAVVFLAACRPTPPPPTPTPTSIPHPTPKTGPATLRIDVAPVGAKVKVDGVSEGHSPLTLTLDAGSYVILVEGDGYEPIQQSMALEVGGEAMVAGRLRDIAPPSIEVSSLDSPIVLGESLRITVQAIDNAGVATISLLEEGTVIHDVEGEGNKNVETEVAWNPVDLGKYSFTVVAADLSGLEAEAEFTILVVPAPTPTSVPSATPTPAATALPPEATATDAILDTVTAEVTASSLNLRSGPSLAYPPIGTVELGQELTVTARDEKGAWLRVCCIDDRHAWLSKYYVTVEGPVDELPIAEEDPPPTAVPQASGPAAVTVAEETTSLLTYPYAEYLTRYADTAHGGVPAWTLDRGAYEGGAPAAQPVQYKLVVLENEFLRLTLLPELGGRVYECVFKPTGHNMFYKNPVVKPTHWGPSTFEGANWWLAAGGLEWGLPVEEHGYLWGMPWTHRVESHPDGGVAVDLWDTDDGRLRTNVRVTLEPGEAAFGLHITLANASQGRAEYQFWSNAMLAPGSGNSVSEGLQFLFPSSQMVVHSTGDPRMPGPWETFSWPVQDGRDVSFVSNWNEYLGFFVHPFAGPGYAAVYDHRDGEGLVHIFPPDVVRGSKGFAFGWGDKAIPSDNWTDDGSTYVELHTGVTPRFDQWATIDAGDSLDWAETWYPIVGLGGVDYADEKGAISVDQEDGRVHVGVHVVQRFEGTISVSVNGDERHISPIASSPGQPMSVSLPAEDLGAIETIGVKLVAAGSVTPLMTVQIDAEDLRR